LIILKITKLFDFTGLRNLIIL